MTKPGPKDSAAPSSYERLLTDYPDAEHHDVVQALDTSQFSAQKHKHLSRGTEGGAIGVVWLASGELVLSRRTVLHPGWALIGGTVERGEGFDEAFIREVKEETALDVTVNRLVTVEHKVFVSPAGEKLPMLLAVFEAMALPAQRPHLTVDAIREGLEIEVFSPGRLPAQMALQDRAKLQLITAQRGERGRFSSERTAGGPIVDHEMPATAEEQLALLQQAAGEYLAAATALITAEHHHHSSRPVIASYRAAEQRLMAALGIAAPDAFVPDLAGEATELPRT